MKLSTVNYLAFAASASALRVAFAPPTGADIASVPENEGPVAWLVRPPTAAEASLPVVTPKLHCGGIRQKAASLSESFRIALGFAVAKKHHGEMSMTDAKTPGGDAIKVISFGIPRPPQVEDEHPHPHPHHHHHHHGEGEGPRHGFGRFRHFHGEPPFLARVHFALMSLGPWEGRAVAFVLGCGIGVLLRMFFVLTVLSFRALRARREPSAEVDYYYATLPADAEEIFVAAPQYTMYEGCADEKAVLRAAAAHAEAQTAPAPAPIPVPVPQPTEFLH